MPSLFWPTTLSAFDMASSSFCSTQDDHIFFPTIHVERRDPRGRRPMEGVVPPGDALYGIMEGWTGWMYIPNVPIRYCRPLLVGWRPLLVGWRPLLVGWRPIRWFKAWGHSMPPTAAVQGISPPSHLNLKVGLTKFLSQDGRLRRLSKSKTRPRWDAPD